MNRYLKSAVRNLWKNKTDSVISISGMAIGLACCVVISLHVSQEFRYDRFHLNAGRIYRVCYRANETIGLLKSDLHPLDLSKKLKDDVPQIEETTGYKYSWTASVKYKDKYYSEKLSFAQPDFFNIFSFNTLQGNPELFLRNPNSVVITEDLAKKLLTGNNENMEDLLGKIIEFPNNLPGKLFIISGILEKVPKTSSMEFSVLLPFDYQYNFGQSNNDFGNVSVYIMAREGTNISQMEKTVSGIVLSFYEAKIKEMQAENTLPDTPDSFTPVLQPLSEVYLGESYENNYIKHGNKTNLFILAGVGLLILLLGCFNFLILSLGKANKKLKIIGIQKAIGARNIDIFKYFYTEVNIFVFLAFVFGIIISYELLPLYNKLAQTDLSINQLYNPASLLVIAALYLFLILLSSLIPVLIISRDIPAVRLKEQNASGSPNKVPFIFVTLQYCLSIILIISSIMINHQVRYMKHKNPGFNTSNILCINMNDMPSNQRMSFRDRLISSPGIINATGTDRNFTGGRSSSNMQNENGEIVEVRFMRADENYIQTLGLQLLEGRSFSAGNITNNDNNIIVNKKFLSSMGIVNDPVGMVIHSPDLPFDVQIMGVINDFNFDPLKEKLMPLALVANSGFEPVNFLLVRYEENSSDKVLSFINKQWEATVPGRQATITFWDNDLSSRYTNEDRWLQIISVASVFSILITSLGLFGLTLFILSMRTKEIGIRKIHGAKPREVMLMLNAEFIRWVAAAFLIASPVAWYVAHSWLNNFAYKTTLSWWIFVTAGIIVSVIALLTVTWQSWRAATGNPVEALRYE